MPPPASARSATATRVSGKTPAAKRGVLLPMAADYTAGVGTDYEQNDGKATEV